MDQESTRARVSSATVDGGHVEHGSDQRDAAPEAPFCRFRGRRCKGCGACRRAESDRGLRPSVRWFCGHVGRVDRRRARGCRLQGRRSGQPGERKHVAERAQAQGRRALRFGSRAVRCRRLGGDAAAGEAFRTWPAVEAAATRHRRAGELRHGGNLGMGDGVCDGGCANGLRSGAGVPPVPRRNPARRIPDGRERGSGPETWIARGTARICWRTTRTG